MEASPICRGKNLTLETVMAFVNAMPKERMQKKEFHAFAESRLKGWTQTHSQIARQLALYYEEDGDCIPRFCSQITNTIVFEYLKHWASLYYVPNLYTPSLTGYNPTNIYAYLRNKIDEGESSFSKACLDLFGIPLNNTDKVRVFLNNFTDIIIEEDQMTRNMGIVEMAYPPITPQVNNIKSGKDFYYYFGDAITSQPTKQGRLTFSKPLQQIFYGAPGTGKSHRIKEIIKEHGLDEKEQVIRTTFHPDSDYSTFVGCYKPIMKAVPQTYIVEGKEKPVIDIATSQQSQKDEIVYDYTPQAFIQVYTKAWTTDKPVILVIEEINRGNCAQIFGDIFQLLDRGDDCVSEYEIKPDKALENYLREYFAAFDNMDEQIKSGKTMKLPANLYIWATMNTSDQSLFPIDSAFKRRWEWKYMPINDHKDKDYKIEIGNTVYHWWGFLARINQVIGDTTSSEDKKLGYFFAKAKGKSIDAEQFVGKVLFYLWNDVFKNYGFDNQIFDKGDKKKFEFSDFFIDDGKPNVEMVNQFLKTLEETIKMEDLPLEIKPNATDDGQGEQTDTL